MHPETKQNYLLSSIGNIEDLKRALYYMQPKSQKEIKATIGYLLLSLESEKASKDRSRKTAIKLFETKIAKLKKLIGE